MKRCFEKVSRFVNDEDLRLPERKTQWSAGYDFMVAEDMVIPPYWELLDQLDAAADPIDEAGDKVFTLDEMAALTKLSKAKPTLVPTGVKCKLDPNTYLELSVRSSCPLKYWLILANSKGIIDADYYNNPDNEGEIFFQMINLSSKPIQLRKGDVIGQGIIHEYLITSDDTAYQRAQTRSGGFGSTDA